MYQVNDHIVHPMHGAGTVEAIESKTISGETRDYYVLRLLTGSVTVLIPVATSDSIGIRPIMSRDKAEQILASFTTIEVEDVSNWNRRYRENMDRIKSGDLGAVACVIKSLTVREMRKPLSTGERKMLASAKQILFSELVLATGHTMEEIETTVKQSVGA